MALLSLEHVTLAYGQQPLLDAVNLKIDAGEHIALIGRNGCGKSTLMRVIHGKIIPDGGEVWKKDGLRIARLDQEVPIEDKRSVFDIVADGLEKTGLIMSEYHNIINRLSVEKSQALSERLAELQHQLEIDNGWQLEQRVNTILTRLRLPIDQVMDKQSGGVKRRVMLAQALVSEPDLLILDEPTNHLDIESILWLEKFLLTFRGAILFVSHDRSLVRKLATRVIELDRGLITSWVGGFDAYLNKKDELLANEVTKNRKFDKKLADEESWLRQGIKARRKRNQGRVRKLMALRVERDARREQAGKANLNLDAGDISGKVVIDVNHVSFSYDNRPIIKDFSTTLQRRDRIGILGPNGCGKSTLLKILIGELKPDSGIVRLGTKLNIAYYDQARVLLDPEKTVLENLNQGKDRITVNGRSRHVIGYLKEFLFPPQQIHSPVKSLSGGERNRLLLARLFAQPANLLVLDEPTNDLDVETLELLEDLLSSYDGTLLLVTHDRAFLDQVVTSTLVFGDDGKITEYIGGYDEYYQATHKFGNTVKNKSQKRSFKEDHLDSTKQLKKRKLSYHEGQELKLLPEQIITLENERDGLQTRINSNDFYRQEKGHITSTMTRLKQIRKELDTAYSRWQELEDIDN